MKLDNVTLAAPPRVTYSHVRVRATQGGRARLFLEDVPGHEIARTRIRPPATADFTVPPQRLRSARRLIITTEPLDYGFTFKP